MTKYQQNCLNGCHLSFKIIEITLSHR